MLVEDVQVALVNQVFKLNVLGSKMLEGVLEGVRSGGTEIKQSGKREEERGARVTALLAWLRRRPIKKVGEGKYIVVFGKGQSLLPARTHFWLFCCN